MYNFKPSSLDCAQFDFDLLFDLLIDLFLFSSFSYLNNLSESVVGYCVCPELLVQCKWRFSLSISIDHLFRVLYCVLRRLLRIQELCLTKYFPKPSAPTACWLQDTYREAQGMQRWAAIGWTAAYQDLEYWQGKKIRLKEKLLLQSFIKHKLL